MYLDANNLYGLAMRKKLPVGGFKWDNPDKYKKEMIKIMMKMVRYGAIFEVDRIFKRIT